MRVEVAVLGCPSLRAFSVVSVDVKLYQLNHAHALVTPSLISLVVSVDVKHHVYLRIGLSLSLSTNMRGHQSNTTAPAGRPPRLSLHRSRAALWYEKAETEEHFRQGESVQCINYLIWTVPGQTNPASATVKHPRY